MINLLPDNQKAELNQEEGLKLASIFGVVIISYFLSLGLLLFLIKGFLSADLETQKIDYNDKKASMEGLKGLKEETAAANDYFSRLNNFYESQIDYSGAFGKIQSILPKEVFLSSVKFLSEKDNMIRVSLSGSSETREALSLFKNSLEMNRDGFSDVSFPPESWIKKNDIKFMITFNILQGS